MIPKALLAEDILKTDGVTQSNTNSNVCLNTLFCPNQTKECAYVVVYIHKNIQNVHPPHVSDKGACFYCASYNLDAISLFSPPCVNTLLYPVLKRNGLIPTFVIINTYAKDPTYSCRNN